MRGINIVNLCCSDYIETWFKPLYDALMVQASHIPEEKRIKQFREIYSLIVDHMGITIFVSEKMNEDMINKEFEQKVQYAEIINIHGIGKRNIKVTESFKNKIAVNPDYEIIKSTVEHDVITVIILKVAKKATISTK
jgi:hypothetical protein